MRLSLALFLAVALPVSAARPPAATLTLRSKSLGETRTVLVSLPAAYEQSSERYPVLYLTDGPLHLEHVAGVVDPLTDLQRMPPVIIVAIKQNDRTHDLTPTHVDAQPASGGGKKFAAFISGELVPLIDARYRTVPCRLYAGHSYGALLGLDMLFDEPARFNAWILVSPTANWDDGYILKRANEFAGGKTSVILMRGAEDPDIVEGTDRLAAVLSKKAIDFASMTFAEEDHVSVPIPAFYAGIRHYFLPWFFRIVDTDDPSTLQERLVKHYEDVSRRYGFRVEIPKSRLDRVKELVEKKPPR